MNMTPIAIESVEKRKCFNQFISGLITKSQILKCLVKTEMLQGWNWKYTTNYWTSGVQLSGNEYVSCSTKNFVENITWARNQPKSLNSTGNCIQMNIYKINSTALLTSRNCGDLAPFVCKVR
jgi:hypothetical protein